MNPRRCCRGKIDLKRQAGLSWVTIKDALRTMQRILSAFSKNNKPPFSQQGLAIPERDKLQMKIKSRQNVSFSWTDAVRVSEELRRMDTLGDARREQYAALILLAAASALRSSELLALKVNDIDFKAGTIRVDESSDQRNNGVIGPCKNAAAYRTVVLPDAEGQKAMRTLRRFLNGSLSDELVFRSKAGGPLLETTILNQGLHPALKSLGLPKGGLHGFRRGCNRRWELAGINPAVIRQQMGHTSQRMTALYSGEIPLDQVVAAFSSKTGTKNVVLENMENEAAA
jgi:integrase